MKGISDGCLIDYNFSMILAIRTYEKLFESCRANLTSSGNGRFGLPVSIFNLIAMK